jgi:uncharacterized caspase-like protein
MASGAGFVAARGARSALIVASTTYQDSALTELRAPAADAEALAGVLSDPEIGGFDVRTLLNEPAHVVNEAVEEFFTDRSPDDLLLLHFACHGIKDQEGELFLAMANTRLRLLAATAVAANFVNRRMTQSRSRRIVLFLDCCYAGAFDRGMTNPHVERHGSRRPLQRTRACGDHGVWSRRVRLRRRSADGVRRSGSLGVHNRDGAWTGQRGG